MDRVACPWLIRKFIDLNAEFLFVPGDQVEAKAAELGAVPFDIDGCELGHHGEDVSFDSILKKYGLYDPALMLLGEIVRAADSRPSNPHPAGEGLRWVAFGFSALGLSDHDMLDPEFIVYDALYAECQRRVVPVERHAEHPRLPSFEAQYGAPAGGAGAGRYGQMPLAGVATS